MNEIIRLDEINQPVAHTGGTTLAVRSDVDADSALDLLQYVASWDNRKASRAQAEAWAISAQLAGWTMAEARNAVRWLLTREREYLTPAMVTARIESQRRRARLSDEGFNEDGTRKVTFAGALQVWRDAFRAAGPNPSAEQEAKAGELLEQMLDGAGDPIAVLTAAVITGRRMNARIDWTAERIAVGKESASLFMPPIPVEYLRDDQLDIRYACMQADFPAEWRLYDPFPAGVSAASKARYLDSFNRYLNGFGRELKHDRTIRDLPDWLIQHFELVQLGSRVNGTDEERKRYTELKDSEPEGTEKRAANWLHDDMPAWERERISVVRQWYADHPNKRPGLDNLTDLFTSTGVRTDPYTGRAFER